jgi:hypothetical protein
MAAGRPDDLDPKAWYEAAIRIDQNQAANAAFRSAHHVASQPKPLTAATATRFQPTVDTRAIALPNRQVFLSRFAHTSPTPGNPVLMDIDAMRRAGKLLPTCFQCGKVGHVINSCPQPMDIRTMGRDEADFLMGHISAQMNEMNLATPAVSEEDELQLLEALEEDFRSSSKK